MTKRIEKLRDFLARNTELSNQSEIHLYIIRLKSDDKMSLLDSKDRNGRTLLSLSAKYCPICMKGILEMGPDMDTRDTDGLTPLMHAVINARKNIAPSIRMDNIALLIERGCALDIADGHGITALAWAAGGDGEAAACVPILLAAGADPNAGIKKHCDTALHMAAMYNPQLVPILIKAGADVNAINSKGETPLLRLRGEPETVRTALQALLEAGADIDAADADGRTALIRCIRRGGDWRCAAIFMEEGADHLMRDRYGKSAEDYLATDTYMHADMKQKMKRLMSDAISKRAKEARAGNEAESPPDADFEL